MLSHCMGVMFAWLLRSGTRVPEVTPPFIVLIFNPLSPLSLRILGYGLI